MVKFRDWIRPSYGESKIDEWLVVALNTAIASNQGPLFEPQIQRIKSLAFQLIDEATEACDGDGVGWYAWGSNTGQQLTAALTALDQSRRAVALAKPPFPQEPPRHNNAPDGPFGIGSFRWRGNEHPGPTPRAQKLLDRVWPADDRSCSLDDAIEAVFGDEHPDVLPDEPLSGPRKDANAFFRAAGIPLAVKVSGGRRM